MPKDNREVLRGLSILEGDKQKTFTDIDEISAFFTQQELDGFVKREILSGDWKSTKLDGETSNVADAGFLSLEETMKRFQEFDFSDEVIESLRHHKPALAEKFGSPTGGGAPSKDDLGSGNRINAADDDSDSANDAGTVQTEFSEKDLNGDSKEVLMEKVEKLRKDGFVIDVQDTQTKAVIIKAILNAKKAEK